MLRIPPIGEICVITLALTYGAAAANLGLPLEPGSPKAVENSSPPAASATDPNVLRVCAAKKQPPLSLEDGTGLENKIAVAIAEAMNRKAQFVWSDKPAIYLVRDYLDKNICDVIVGLDTGDPRVASSNPYYRTGYVFVTRADRDIDIRSWSDPRLKTLGRIAVTFGSPSEIMLKDIGQYESNMAYLYSLVNFRSPRNEYTQIDPTRLVSEVASGAADIAVAFAPDVARYIKASAVPLRASLIADDAVKSSGEKVPQSFNQSVGVRNDDKALLDQINAALEKAKPRIDAILAAEGVPLQPIKQ
jgi:mxaJ protein